ncbi:MAG: phosphoribosylformylglycinamidine synthase subunit PurL [Acidobacteria bacterium]|nr:phosphoribosylformylglycinamidine synthase subunit PurL [Acidobacteriota bacterium]
MPITPEILDQHNVTPDEYERIKRLLGREPNLTELGIFSVMWSEHCSYKSSKVHLKRLPVEGECLVQGPGENAGIVDIGDGWCVAFKIESHNHPSFIEPYQGAATGVGGILRDIFTMGARPVAAMNSLRFGPVRDEDVDDSREQTSSTAIARNRRIMAGVVKGLGDYGNAFGVPTVGGEVYFADCYSLNPLVNAFALGLVRREQIFYGKAEGIGNSVIYVGAKTGRDGIHGATMASAEFDEAAMEKRPTVQVGDPFAEKLLLEACLEAMRAGAIVGIQDMGAAGLTSSSCEMGARAGTGIEINLDLVPQRETGMTAYEMMLSESQERMLIVAARGHDRQVLEIFQRWELDAVIIGHVTNDQKLRVIHQGQVVAEIPNLALTDEAPRYHRPQQPIEIKAEDVGPKIEAAISNPKSQIPNLKSQISNLKSQLGDEPLVFNEILRRLVASPNLASKQWVYRQYDHMVRTNTVVLPGSDAAVIRVKETRRNLAMSLDGNGRYCHLDPREGAKLAVAEAARNVVCSGARPLAITNCLNFASPERPEVMWAFSETIDGMAEACRAFNVPVTGGNVSFYNETEGRGVYPTPVIGMLGLIEDAKHTTTQWFKEAGDVILLLGATRNDLGASELLSVVAGEASGAVPRLDLETEKAVQQTCLTAIQEGLVSSAHDCSDGGLAVALAESCFSSYRRNAVGARIDLSGHAKSSGLKDALALLFSESPSRIIISAKPEHVDRLREIARQNGVVCEVIGETGGDQLSIVCDGESLVEGSVAALESAWRNSLPLHLDRPMQAAAG